MINDDIDRLVTEMQSKAYESSSYQWPETDHNLFQKQNDAVYSSKSKKTHLPKPNIDSQSNSLEIGKNTFIVENATTKYK